MPGFVRGAVRRQATTYDVRGLVDKITSYNATGGVVNDVKNEFNGLGQLTRQFQECDGPQTGGSVNVQYAYDASAAGGQFTKGSRPVSVTYPNGRVVNMNYGVANGVNDKLARIGGILDGASAVVNYTYLGLGSFVVADLTQPQVKLDYTAAASGDAKYPGLDRFNRVVDHRWIHTPSGQDRDRFKYGYDRNSNRMYRENVTAQQQSPPKAFDELYAYDRNNRLIDFKRGVLATDKKSITGTPTRAQAWQLDATGNWPRFTSQTDGTVEVDQTRTHNAVNEITDLSVWFDPRYDAAGNMTRMPRPDQPTEGFAAIYDAWNRLVRIRDIDECGCPDQTIADYAYNGLNWRTKKVVASIPRRFYYTASWQCIEERVGGASFPERQYIWGLRYIDDLLLRDRDTNADGSLDERLFPTQDANWNVTSLLNTSGATQERYAYDPYGNVTFFDATYAPRLASQFAWDTLFASYRNDDESRLHFVRYRSLNSPLGKWLERDPRKSGVNLYEYVNSRPETAVDPFGLECCPVARLIAARAFGLPQYDHLCIQIDGLETDTGHGTKVCQTWSIELLTERRETRPDGRFLYGAGDAGPVAGAIGGSLPEDFRRGMRWGIWVYPDRCESEATGSTTRISWLVPKNPKVGMPEFALCLYRQGIQRARLAEANRATYRPRRNSNSYAMEVVRACDGLVSIFHPGQHLPNRLPPIPLCQSNVRQLPVLLLL